MMHLGTGSSQELRKPEVRKYRSSGLFTSGGVTLGTHTSHALEDLRIRLAGVSEFVSLIHNSGSVFPETGEQGQKE